MHLFRHQSKNQNINPDYFNEKLKSLQDQISANVEKYNNILYNWKRKIENTQKNTSESFNKVFSFLTNLKKDIDCIKINNRYNNN